MTLPKLIQRKRSNKGKTEVSHILILKHAVDSTTDHSNLSARQQMNLLEAKFDIQVGQREPRVVDVLVFLIPNGSAGGAARGYELPDILGECGGCGRGWGALGDSGGETCVDSDS